MSEFKASTEAHNLAEAVLYLIRAEEVLNTKIGKFDLYQGREDIHAYIASEVVMREYAIQDLYDEVKKR